MDRATEEAAARGWHGPVMVGDTIGATVKVTAIKPASKHGRAVVTSQIDVFKNAGTHVMTYVAVRLLAGRAAITPI